MKNPLSDIYSKQVLLNEEKDNVVVPAGKMEIAKGGKIPQAHTGGDEKVKKDIEHPEEHEEYSDGEKAKPMPMKETASYEGAFEKLFKATLNEDVADDMAMDVEIPTNDEDMANEITDTSDEVSDLVSDLKSVMDHLQNILDRISEESNANEEQDEVQSEFGEEDEEEEVEEVEESVHAEEKGHALHNLKAGTELQKPSSKEVKGAVKVSKGTASSEVTGADPKLKVLGKTEDLHNPKKKPEVKSTVKVGDFFK